MEWWKLRYLSLFSGIEAATVAWDKLGWEPVAFAQYEPGDNVQFPSQVLAYHYPNVPNLGDVTKITEEQIAALGHIDLLVGGSPCQDLSVAGKRAGLRKEDGSVTRSGLFDYQLQIFEWARKNNGCRFMLWENVPGAYSSNQGNDFAYILGSMVQRDVAVPSEGWQNSGVCVSEDWGRAVEWATLDSQYFHVAQRRRRCFALLDTGAWWSRPPILLEPESLSGDSPKGEGTRKGTSRAAEEDLGGNGLGGIFGDTDDAGAGDVEDEAYGFYPQRKAESQCFTKEVMPALTIGTNPGFQNGVVTPEDKAYAMTTGNFTGLGEDVCPTLMMRDYKDPTVVGFENKAIAFQTGHTKGCGNGVNEDDVSYTISCANDHAVAYRLDPTASNSMKSSNPHSGFHEEDVCCTLDTSDQNPVKGQGGMAVVQPVDDAFAVDVRNSKIDSVAGAVQASADHNLNSNNVVMEQIPHAFCKTSRPKAAGESPTWKDAEVTNTLNTFDLGETRCNELVVDAAEDTPDAVS